MSPYIWGGGEEADGQEVFIYEYIRATAAVWLVGIETAALWLVEIVKIFERLWLWLGLKFLWFLGLEF